MTTQYRDIIKHSAVYGAGQILTRVASVVLLPLYTHYLRPADYGAMAILDLTGSVLGILIGGGMVAAANRYHFDSDDPRAQAEVWWTSLLVLAAAATVLLAPAFLLREPLARLTLGAEQPAGALFYALVLPTVWLTAIAEVPDRYLRVRKWSWLVVVISLGGLALNIALNVYFLTVKEWGVAGVLLGNLLTALATAAVRCAIMARACRPVHVRAEMAGHLWRFGRPMMATALLAMSMHQADRYVLRFFLPLDEIGVYSLAYTIGQGVNALCLIPFAAIWGVVMYEIARHPDAKRIYARVFEYFVYVLLLALLGVSLFIDPLLRLLVSSDYSGAAALVPIVCLGFVFFSLHAHFSVPALLAKQSDRLVVVYASAAVTNVALDVLLVPLFGLPGAAWASVGGYAVFSGVALMRYRAIDRYDYPLARCSAVLAAMVASYVACRYVGTLPLPVAWSIVTPASVWAAWAVALGYPLLKKHAFRIQDLAAAS